MLAVWLAGGLLLTLQPAHPAPGQFVEHNLIPLRTIAIYLANLDSGFWVRQLVGSLLLLLPVGLVGPIVLPWMDRWARVLVASIAISVAIELVSHGYPGCDVEDHYVRTAGPDCRGPRAR